MGHFHSKPAHNNVDDPEVIARKNRNRALRIEHHQWKKTVSGTAHAKRPIKHRDQD